MQSTIVSHKSLSQYCGLSVGLLLTTVGFLAGPLTSASGQVLFFDDFNGPILSSAWQASLPTMNIASPRAGATQVTTYLGAPHTAFQSLESSSVLRLSNTLNQHQRVGLSTTQVFGPAGFSYEVRFNTLNQSQYTSIDGFLEIGILDAANPAHYDILSPYGGFFSTSRSFAAGSSIDNAYSDTLYNYQDNTWYRMVLQGAPGSDLRASLLSDSGTELVSYTLAHTADAYSSGFRLVLSQAMGEPQPAGQWPVDVAVDYAKLTVVPEPACAALFCSGFIFWAVARRGTRNGQHKG